MQKLGILIGLAMFSLPGAVQAQSRRVVVINGRSPVTRCGTTVSRARQNDPWGRARQRARQNDPWGRAQQRARTRLDRVRQRARDAACQPPRAQAVPPRNSYVDPWGSDPWQGPDPWGRPYKGTANVTHVATGRTTRVYVAKPIYPGRQATPVHELRPTGRTTRPPRAIATGRVDPWAKTRRTSRPTRAQLAETTAIELLTALQRSDWKTVCRLGAKVSRGEVDAARLQEAFWAQFPSPTLVRDARQGLTRHCQDRASMLSLLRVLGDRPEAVRGS